MKTWDFLGYGGERGSRTLDTLRYTHFPGVLLRPLGHLTVTCLQLKTTPSRRRANVHKRSAKRNANCLAKRQKMLQDLRLWPHQED